MARRAGFSDTFKEIFGDEQNTDPKYPGSKKSRREAPPKTEFIASPWKDNYTLKFIGGEERRFYTVGALAVALGVSVQSIRLWITKGYIPQAPYRMPDMEFPDGTTRSGRRLYTEELIDAAVKVFHDHGILGQPRINWVDSQDVTLDVLNAWTAITQGAVDLSL